MSTEYTPADYRRMIYIYNAYKTGWTIRRGINDSHVIITKLKLPCDDICLFFIECIDFYLYIFKNAEKLADAEKRT
jgi:hypothetical protein